MKVLTREMLAESLEWYNTMGDEYVKFDGRGLYYKHPEAATITLALPNRVERLPYFVHRLGLVCCEQIHFLGATIWLTDVGIWNEFEEGIGYQILESINAAAGQPLSFCDTRGYHFRADELVKTLGMLIQPMIFGWDAYYLPRWNWGGCSDYFLKVSHHSCVEVHTMTRQFHDAALKELVAAEFDLLTGRDGMISRYVSKSELLGSNKPDPDPSTTS